LLRIVAIGSPQGDDQIGWQVARELLADEVPGVHTHTVRNPIELLDVLDGSFESLLIVHACDDGLAPGSVLVQEWCASMAEPAGRSSHGPEVHSALQLAGSLGKLPNRVILCGIQVDRGSERGEVSRSLKQAWSEVVSRLRSLLIEPGSTGHQTAITAKRFRVLGRVQGVGFRPSVARLAAHLQLHGWVKNTSDGVVIHLEGGADALESFPDRLREDQPPAAEIHAIEAEDAAVQGLLGFKILPSDASGNPGDASSPGRVLITPDLAVCSACLAEVDNPDDRRHGFALNGCTDCGPRFSIQVSAPFDRERTTMLDFRRCPECEREYADPMDRRFHAQNIACPICGPRLWLESFGQKSTGPSEHAHDLDVLDQVATLLREGRIVGAKGIGGFHLLCDATAPTAVARLRERKRRDRKPFAVLFRDLSQVSEYAEIDEASRLALVDPSAPIVLVQRRGDSRLAEGLAPGLSTVGAFIAYTPLHRSLVQRLGRPMVATSANPTDEPMPVDNEVARRELSGLADVLLLHDRRILRHADDSVIRIIRGAGVPVRIGRGLAPVRIELPFEPPPFLATGGQLKAAIAFTRGRELFLGQHIGDLETLPAQRRFAENVSDLTRLFGTEPTRIAHDLHPDYFTTRFAEKSGLKRLAVQHHHAHVMACLAEHGERGPALGIAWDGTGYGDDGTIWGGEFLRVEGTHCVRVGSLWPFRLVGGDRAAREPRRSAVGVCHAAEEALPEGTGLTGAELSLLRSALKSSGASMTTTSAGRLFDAWASLLGVAHVSAYEGEAAMRLEEIADPAEREGFSTSLVECPDAKGTPIRRIDWRPWVAETGRLRSRGEPVSRLSARFHNALVASSLEMAQQVGVETVVLSGGCFMNRFLTARLAEKLEECGFRVLVHRRVPPGDGGLAVGQLWVAALQWYSQECRG
jgi:hydrogenase maturation protein HypF